MDEAACLVLSDVRPAASKDPLLHVSVWRRGSLRGGGAAKVEMQAAVQRGAAYAAGYLRHDLAS